MKKIFKYLSALICTSLCFICILSSFISKDTNIQTPTRDVELNEVNVDYESEFSKYEDAKLEYSKDNGYVSFSGIINYSSNDLSDIDLVSITNDNQDRLSIKYSFDYEVEENLFYMNVEAINTDNGTIFDRIVGVPFENENSENDIIFDVEGEYIYLSELIDNMLLENCGWFSKVLKKVAKVAAVVAVAAVVVTACAYTAPAVIAVASGSFAATTAGTTVFMAGAVATSTLATCAAVGSAAATTALVAAMTAVTNYLASKSFDTFEEKVEAAVVELKKTNKFSGEMIYRADLTGNAYKSLTPRPADITGLSFFNNIPYMFGALTITKGVYITTTTLVNDTGILKAKQDGNYHYSVVPVNNNMSDWISSYSTAKTNPHQYTRILKEICFYVSGI